MSGMMMALGPPSVVAQYGCGDSWRQSFVGTPDQAETVHLSGTLGVPIDTVT
jgi:hypothetical protein